MQKPDALKFIKQFIDTELANQRWYMDIKSSILAIILYGSVAKGINRPDSDIDVLLIVPLKAEEKYTAGEYFYKYKGYEINIVLRSIERLRQIAAESEDKFQKEIFRGAEIVYERDHEVRNLLEAISNI